MARTKQTAKKSTGGKAPRKALKAKATRSTTQRSKVGQIRRPMRFKAGSK